jgi:predicted outer membrane repeat protein
MIVLAVGCGDDTTVPPDTRPEPIVVNPDGSGTHPTIQAGINAAATSDTVHLGNGTFTGSGNRDIDYLGKRIILRSQSGDPDSCIIDCQGSSARPHRGFVFHSSEQPWCVLQGVTITNGHADNGGAILCTEVSSPTITNCRFLSNSVDESGGALFLVDYSSPVLSGCAFSHNSAQDDGGAVYCGDCAPAFANCTFADNTAAQGGAVSCFNTPLAVSPTLTGCTFYGNSPDGIFCDNARITLQRTIIAFGLNGPAVRCQAGCVVALSCCDVYGNAGGDWVGCIEDQAGTGGNISADPLFCDPESGDLYLQAGSPCVLLQGCGRVGAWPVGCD